VTRLLEVKSLEGGYDSVQILYEIDIHVDEGEFVTIIGPNGCGKSTLIKTIFGLATYYRGEVSYRGADVSGMRTDQLVNMGISYVPQVDNVFPSLSVIENMRMGGNKLQPQTLSDRIERSLEMFPDLRSREFDLAASLSGGERQMLAISRALISNPNFLLLDEPTAGINPTLINGIIDRLIKVNQDFGITLLVIEHNMRVIMQLAESIYCLAHGKMLANGTPDEIKNDKRVIDAYLGAQ